MQSFWVRVTRPQDLLEFTLEFRDVEVTAPQVKKPATLKGQNDSRLVVYFQSQHLAEQAIFEKADGFGPTKAEKDTLPKEWLERKYKVPDDEPAPPLHERGMMQAILSGPSRLVFGIPPGKEIDYTLKGILDALGELPLLVSPIMTYKPPGCGVLFPFNLLWPAAPEIGKPGKDITAIEAPYRLILSPDDQARWRHQRSPVAHNGRTELWHTRLWSGDVRRAPLLRAIWSPDFDPKKHIKHEDKPFRMSLDAHDRNELVHLTSNWHLNIARGGSPTRYRPEPVEAEQLMLSSLGAWLKVYGDWPVRREINLPEKNNKLTIEEWRHEATMGRDQYVRVVYAGHLYPCEHEASLVKITERKFLYEPEQQGYTAYLFQRMYIIVREPKRGYTHRHMPFRSLTIKTRVTPNLNIPKESEAIEKAGQDAFWPRITLPDGKTVVDFQFRMVGEDWEGKQSEFTSPLIFVSLDLDGRPSDMKKVANAYNNAGGNGIDEKDGRRYRPLYGQPVAFAPTGPDKRGSTTLATKFISFKGTYQSGSTPHFRPEMSLATVDIPSVSRMTGASKAYDIRLHEAFTEKYKNNPNSTTIGNNGDVFASVAQEKLTFQVDKGGGLVAPDINITGLSRAFGPVDNDDHGIPGATVANGYFNGPAIFGAGVKLLGGIELGTILAPDKNFGDPAKAASAGRVPGLTSEIIDVGGVKTAVTKYTYRVDDKLGFGGSGLDLFKPNDDTEFVIESEMKQPLNGDPGTYRLSGKLREFAVELGIDAPPAGVRIEFQELSFLAVNDKKPDVSVDLRGVEFLGILAFVNTLSEVIPLDGFSDPPHLDITPNGIELGYSLGLPMTAVGMFSLQNISLSAGVFLPLMGDKPLNFRFAFCERHQPFLMTVTLFGGGGFVGLEVGLHGLVMVEAALEFGAAAAINLGVASGALSFMGGVYYQKAGKSFDLTGYFRANGALSVLGLITVSVEFYLGLTYTSKDSGSAHAGAMWGQAKLTVKIKIAFFSKSVSMSMEREFAGADPTFAQLMEPKDWTRYCEAFAPV